MRSHDVCAFDELRDRVPHEVAVDRARLVLIRVEDKLHVMHATCPHMGGPLGKGRVRPGLEGDPGRIRVDATKNILTCPWHNWEFDLESGCALFDPSMSVRKFRAEVVDGRVLVSSR